MDMDKAVKAWAACFNEPPGVAFMLGVAVAAGPEAASELADEIDRRRAELLRASETN